MPGSEAEVAIEKEPLNPHEEAIEVVEHVLLHVMHVVVGADIGRDGGSGDEERGEAGTESVEIVSVRRDVVS